MGKKKFPNPANSHIHRKVDSQKRDLKKTSFVDFIDVETSEQTPYIRKKKKQKDGCDSVTQWERRRQIPISDILLWSDSQDGWDSRISPTPSNDMVAFQCTSQLLLSVDLGIRHHKFLTYFLYHFA